MLRSVENFLEIEVSGFIKQSFKRERCGVSSSG